MNSMRKTWIALSLACAIAFAAAAAWSVPRGLEAGLFMAAADDPPALADLALAKSFDARLAAREIEEALAADDAELAQSFVALAAERGVAVDPTLAERVAAANAPAAARMRAVEGFVRGFVTGAPTDAASFAGTAAGDLFVFGDVRDALREGTRAARGEEADTFVLGLAAAGVALTAGTYVSFGAAAPARAGVSIVKAAARAGRVGKKLAVALKGQRADGLVRFASDVGHVQSKAGARAALDGLKIADHPKDVGRLARLAEVKGGKTRAIVKVLGRGAIALTTGLFEIASWIFWAIANVIAFCAALKRTVERLSLRAIRRRKAKTARLASAQAAV